MNGCAFVRPYIRLLCVQCLSRVELREVCVCVWCVWCLLFIVILYVRADMVKPSQWGVSDCAYAPYTNMLRLTHSLTHSLRLIAYSCCWCWCRHCSVAGVRVLWRILFLSLHVVILIWYGCRCRICRPDASGRLLIYILKISADMAIRARESIRMHRSFIWAQPTKRRMANEMLLFNFFSTTNMLRNALQPHRIVRSFWVVRFWHL